MAWKLLDKTWGSLGSGRTEADLTPEQREARDIAKGKVEVLIGKSKKLTTQANLISAIKGKAPLLIGVILVIVVIIFLTKKRGKK